MAYLRDVLAWFKSLEERGVEETVRLRNVAHVCTGRCVGNTSVSGRRILEIGQRSEVSFHKGCLEADRGRVDSLWTDIRVLRGRGAWVRQDGAPEPEVNDEDEQLGIMHGLMDNLAESALLVLNFQGANDELQMKRLHLQGRISALQLDRF